MSTTTIPAERFRAATAESVARAGFRRGHFRVFECRRCCECGQEIEEAARLIDVLTDEERLESLLRCERSDTVEAVMLLREDLVSLRTAADRLRAVGSRPEFVAEQLDAAEREVEERAAVILHITDRWP